MSDGAYITDLAREFHETRQRLAPAFGVLVLGEKFDPESPIGELLIAVIEKIADRIVAEREQAPASQGYPALPAPIYAVGVEYDETNKHTVLCYSARQMHHFYDLGFVAGKAIAESL